MAEGPHSPCAENDKINVLDEPYFGTHILSDSLPSQTFEIPKKNTQPLISTRGLAFYGLLRSSEKWKFQDTALESVWNKHSPEEDQSNWRNQNSQKWLLTLFVISVANNSSPKKHSHNIMCPFKQLQIKKQNNIDCIYTTSLCCEFILSLFWCVEPLKKIRGCGWVFLLIGLALLRTTLCACSRSFWGGAENRSLIGLLIWVSFPRTGKMAISWPFFLKSRALVRPNLIR